MDVVSGGAGGTPTDDRGSQRAARRLDPHLETPLVVVGSLPPSGRDLDVLVTAEQRAGAERALQQAGFVRRGDEWVTDGGDTVVELVAAETWGVSRLALSRLHEEAEALPGLDHLLRPAPHAVLLLLARQLPLSGRLQPKRRRRALDAAASGPDVWTRAEAVAAEWSAQESLALLRACLEGAGTTRLRRVRAAAERLAAQEPSRRFVRARAWKQVLAARAAGPAPLIALSGLDGAGKSTQAGQLVQALGDAGYDAVVQWKRISYDSSLRRLTAPIRVVLRVVGGPPVPLPAGLAPPGADDPESGFYIAPEDRAARRLRERLPWLSAVWVTLVVLSHAVGMRRETLREVASGRLVVRDRYVLDALVHLEDRYGAVQGVALQRWLLRVLAPRPLAGFFLDVSPHEAYARKPEEHTVTALERHRELYLEHAPALGTVVVDGRAEADQVARELFRRVESSLRSARHA